MRWMLIALALVGFGCDGGDASPAERLAGNWIFLPADGSSGLGLTLQADGDYNVMVAELTSSNTANAEIEIGVFSANDTEIMFYPRKWSCPGPDPSYIVRYALSGSSLGITGGSTLVSLERNPYPASTNFAITTGCMQTGTFVPMPIAPL